MEKSKARLAPRDAIERFLKTSRQPVLIEPGDDPIAITAANFVLEGATLQCWSDTRNLVRRIRDVHSERRGRLQLEVERFGGRTGRLTLVDLANPSNRDAPRQGSRLKYREQFRRSLRRQFPEWKLVELSTEQNLQHTLSPSYPRALLKRGNSGMAAIGAGDDALDPDGVLTFGLIWLDYLRQREQKLSVEGLVVFVPIDKEGATCHRVRYLNPKVASYLVFTHAGDGIEDQVNPGDYTNFDTHIDVCRQPLAGSPTDLVAWVNRVARIENVERRDHPDGAVVLSVHGLEFARAFDDSLMFGLDRKHRASAASLDEIEQLALGLARMRRAEVADRSQPLFALHPEAWLEAQIRGQIDSIDATLHTAPVYGQVPQFAAGDRGIIDVLAADRHGRLAVVEVKASEDVHLPLQALDYWMRVKWHLDRNEFAGRGYFAGISVRQEAPRLILVAPALDFHPSNETVLRYFSRQVQVERVGVGIEWRQKLRVMFRK